MPKRPSAHNIQSNRDMVRRSCRTKRRFKDHEAALDFCKRLQHGLGDRYDKQRVYECFCCKGFHLSGHDFLGGEEIADQQLTDKRKTGTR